MKTLKQFLAEHGRKKTVAHLKTLCEYKTYQRIPGTSSSYRQDIANTNTQTQPHVHVYAKPNGNGKELYSVNLDGSGHDGSSGTYIPSAHADFLRSNGYNINPSNILESLDVEQPQAGGYSLILMEDA